jgi:hypothetical protein
MVRCRKTNFGISVIRPDRGIGHFSIVCSAASGETIHSFTALKG